MAARTNEDKAVETQIRTELYNEMEMDYEGGEEEVANAIANTITLDNMEAWAHASMMLATELDDQLLGQDCELIAAAPKKVAGKGADSS